MSITKITEVLANVAVITVSAIAGVAVWYQVADRPSVVSKQTTPYKVGETLTNRLDVDFSKVDETLVVVMSTSCHYCAASLPFYRRIVAERDRTSRSLRIVAAAKTQDVTCGEYLRSNDVRVDEVVTFDRRFAVHGTPTLFVLDRQGHVVGVWQGQLPPAEEGKLWSMLFGNRRG